MKHLRLVALSVCFAALAGSTVLGAPSGYQQYSQLSFWDMLVQFISQRDLPSLNFGPNRPPTVVGVPGPIAGAGLPIAVAAGIYFWRRRANGKTKA